MKIKKICSEEQEGGGGEVCRWSQIKQYVQLTGPRYTTSLEVLVGEKTCKKYFLQKGCMHLHVTFIYNRIEVLVDFVSSTLCSRL